MSPELHGIWQGLGVVVEGSAVSFDANAPMAAIRRAIETPIA